MYRQTLRFHLLERFGHRMRRLPQADRRRARQVKHSPGE
jgi:hypothetical protein